MLNMLFNVKDVAMFAVTPLLNYYNAVLRLL